MAPHALKESARLGGPLESHMVAFEQVNQRQYNSEQFEQARVSLSF